MQVLNIHEREMSAAASAVGGLINSLASEHDRLWPRTMWPPMRLDRPLGVGASGGHGPVSYVVEEFVPGQTVRFRFTRPRGFHGHHWFEAIPAGEHKTLLRHTISLNAKGPASLYWSLVIRPLHDALLEDALALAQAALGEPPVVRTWSRWVKFLRRALSGPGSRRRKIQHPLSRE